MAVMAIASAVLGVAGTVYGDFQGHRSARDQRNALAIGDRQGAIDSNKEIISSFKQRRAALGLGQADFGMPSQNPLELEGNLSEKEYLTDLYDKISPTLNLGGEDGITGTFDPLSGTTGFQIGKPGESSSFGAGMGIVNDVAPGGSGYGLGVNVWGTEGGVAVSDKGIGIKIGGTKLSLGF